MANTIRLKSGSGNNPSASDLVVGEVALRTDGNPKLFTKNDAGNVVEVGLVESGSIVAGSIVNADINASAAIAGTKISPNFGGQNIQTTGQLQISGALPTILLNDENNENDFEIRNQNGSFIIRDIDNPQTRYTIASSGMIHTFHGAASFSSNLDVGAGIDVTGLATVIRTTSSETESILKVLHSNLSQGIGFGYNTISAIGSNTNVDLNIASKGSGHINMKDNLDCEAGLDVIGNIGVSGTVDGVDIATRDTLFGGLTSSSGVLTDGVTATTQSAGDNSTKVATTAYTDTAISNLVDSSPSTLNTLNELAAALGDDANFSTTVTNSIATKLPLAGGTLTGNLTLNTTQPRIRLNDSNNNPDYSILNEDGIFGIYDDTNSSHRLTISSSAVDINVNLDANAGLDVTGNITATGDLTVTGGDVIIQGVEAKLHLTDTNNDDDYLVFNNNGTFKVYDATNNADRLTIASNGRATLKNDVGIDGNLDVGNGLDVTGGITASSTGNASLILDAGTGSQAGNQISFIDFKLDGTVKANIAVNEATSGNPLEINSAGTGATKLFNAGSEKLATFSGGISVTGQVNSDGSHMGDNDKAIFGDSNDLQLYHDGSHSYLDNNTGSFRIRDAGGAEKLKVHGTGVTVTGTCTATTFSGSGASLTNIPAAQLTGTLPALDGSNLTGLTVDNAQTLDNLDSTQFLRSDTSDTFTGTLTYGGTGTAFNFTSTSEVILANHSSNSTPVAFDIRKSGTSMSDSNTYGVLHLTRTSHNNSATSAGAALHFRLKDSGGNLREYAGISGQKTEAGAAGGQLEFHRYGRASLGYWNASGLYVGGNKVFHAGNDGSGSGLDADALRGIGGQKYLTSYNDATGGWEDSNMNFRVTTGGSAAGLAFHESDGTFAFQLYGDGTSYGFLDSNWGGWDIRKYINGQLKIRIDSGGTDHTVWCAGNDGSGSTLDADTVDGLQASQFLRNDADSTIQAVLTTRRIQVQANHDIRFTNGDWTGDTTKIQHHSNYLYIVGGSNGIIFREANLNRAILDGDGHFTPGTDSTYDLGVSARRWRNGYFDTLYGSGAGLTSIPAGQLTGISSLAFSGSNITNLNASNLASGTVPAARLGSASASEAGISVVGNFGQFQTHSTYSNFNTEPSYWGWNFVHGTTNAPNSTSGQWYRCRLSLGSEYGKGSGGGDYSLEMAIPRYNHGSAGGLHIRTIEAGTEGSWLEVASKVAGGTVFHTNNDGSGSGLDADTVDGVQVSNLVRSDQNDVLSGDYSFTGGAGAINISSSDIRSSNNSNWTGNPGSGALKIQAHSNRWYIVANSSSNRIVQFRQDGTDRTWIANDGQIYHGSGSSNDKYWRQGNDGSGSGLDADTVDGTQANSLIRSGAQSSVSGWHINAYRNGSGTSPHIYFSHNGGYGQHINTYNTASSVYALQLHNNSREIFAVYNDGSAYHRGNTRWDDGYKAQFGTNSDLSIWHDGSHTRISHTGTGQLVISGNDNDQVKLMKGNSEEGIVLNNNGNVELYHNNDRVFRTETRGVRFGDNTRMFENSAHNTAVIQHADVHHAIILRGHTNNNGSTITNSNTTTFREYGQMQFRTGGNGNMPVRLTIASNGVVSGNLNDTSDAKFKENIVSIVDGAISKIKQLRPVNFDWKKEFDIDGNEIEDKDAKGESGFIAQEVLTVIPNLVKGNEYNDDENSTGYSVNTTGLVAYLTKALQEAIARIEDLESKVNS